MGPTQRQLTAVVQHDRKVAMSTWPQLSNAIGIDDSRSMDSHKSLGIEPLQEGGEARAVQVRPPTRVKVKVHTGGVNPIQIPHLQERHATAGFEDDALERPRTLLERRFLVQQAADLRYPLRFRRVLQGFTRMCQRRLEALVAEGLQQVIQSVGFKRTNRVLVVRCHENCHRHADWWKLAQHAKAVELGHVDIEKQQVWLSGSDQRDAFTPVARDADDLDIVAAFEQFQ